MIQTAFDADEWVGRLGASLDALVAEAKFSFSLDDGQGPYLTLDQIRALYEGAGSRPRIRDTMMPSGVQWSGGSLAEPRAILRDHPELRRALKGIGKDEGLLFLFPHRTDVVSSKELVLSLLRRTAILTGQETARQLHRYLADGAARQLEAREFVVVYGLKLAGRIDLGNGAFLAPLDERFISDEGFAEEDADKLKSFGAGSEDFRKESGGSSVFVRDLQWGPGVAPGSDGRNIEMAEISHRFPCDVETVVNLLSVASRCPLATSARHIQVARWMHEINTNSRFGLWRSISYSLDGWWEEQALSGEAEDRFKTLITGWTGFQFNSDVGHALNLAVSRLSGSFARIGPWKLQDKILDYAIALEILYRLDSSELTYKLGTRAAFLLCRKPETRRSTFEKITDFYDIRSAIVHGPTKKKHRNLGYKDFEQACTDGCDLACDTLLELLQRGCFPDWKDLVFDAPAAPMGHPRAGATLKAGG